MARSTVARATDESRVIRYRFERKFLAPGMVRAEVELLVKCHPALFFEEYPRRWVNNVYWDRIDLKDVRDNLIGIGRRQKTRVRWYGDFEGRIVKPVLERKIRRGNVGWKESRALEPFEIGTFLEPARIERLPGPRSSGLRPTLLNRYSRMYFRSADRRFRLTIDTSMSYHTAGPLRIDLRRWMADRQTVLIELKYATAHDDDAALITRHFPFRVSRNSKYITGMMLTNPRVSV